MKAIELFTNRELLAQVLKNLHKNRKIRKYLIRITITAGFLLMGYGLAMFLTYVSKFINYVIWGINI